MAACVQAAACLLRQSLDRVKQRVKQRGGLTRICCKLDLLAPWQHQGPQCSHVGLEGVCTDLDEVLVQPHTQFALGIVSL